MSLERHYFCTLFDQGYLVKGLAMMDSLSRYCPSAHLYVLCLDQKTQHILEQLTLPNVTCIPLAAVETAALLQAKANRSVAEYCWTLSPTLPWHILEKFPEINRITYIDSDLLFYSPLAPIFEEMGNASITIIEHRFSEVHKKLEVNGRFCVQWVTFRRNEEGMRCLNRWRQQCIEWCYYRLEDGKMGDQKYLDEWPALYPSCHILQYVGAGVAPWNYSRYRFDQDNEGRITVDGELLIFYHFHQFQFFKAGRRGIAFDRLSKSYTYECQEPEAVYATYEVEILASIKRIKAIAPRFDGGFKVPLKLKAQRLAQAYLPQWVKQLVRRVI